MTEKIGLCLIFLLTLAAPAFGISQSYFVLQGGQAQHTQNSMEDSDTRPTGMVYGAGLGTRKEYFEFEAVVNKGDLSVDIKHDGAANTIKQDQIQVALAVNFYFTKMFYARMGYSFINYSQKTAQQFSSASQLGLEQEYGLKKKVRTDGAQIGAGVVLLHFKQVDMFAQYEYSMYSSEKATQHQITAGVRWYFGH